MYASSKPSTHRHRRAEIPQYPRTTVRGMYRAHIRAHSRDVCIGKHRAHREKERRDAFTLDSDRARVSELYSLFHAGKPRERLDQPDPASKTRTELRKEEREGKRERRRERKWKRERERKTVKRYLSHELREKSMSTAVNYDKCRECDAAISRYHQRRADSEGHL